LAYQPQSEYRFQRREPQPKSMA